MKESLITALRAAMGENQRHLDDIERGDFSSSKLFERTSVHNAPYMSIAYEKATEAYSQLFGIKRRFSVASGKESENGNQRYKEAFKAMASMDDFTTLFLLMDPWTNQWLVNGVIPMPKGLHSLCRPYFSANVDWKEFNSKYGSDPMAGIVSLLDDELASDMTRVADAPFAEQTFTQTKVHMITDSVTSAFGGGFGISASPSGTGKTTLFQRMYDDNMHSSLYFEYGEGIYTAVPSFHGSLGMIIAASLNYVDVLWLDSITQELNAFTEALASEGVSRGIGTFFQRLSGALERGGKTVMATYNPFSTSEKVADLVETLSKGGATHTLLTKAITFNGGEHDPDREVRISFTFISRHIDDRRPQELSRTFKVANLQKDEIDDLLEIERLLTEYNSVSGDKMQKWEKATNASDSVVNRAEIPRYDQ